MIKNLLRPKWQHPDAAIRFRAIEEGRLEADVLFELAKSDPDPGVRARAVSRLQDIQQLITVAECRQQPADPCIADRLHELILAADPQAMPDTRTLQRCCDLCSAEEQQKSLLMHAPYAELRQMVAESFEQQDALMQCVLNDSSGEVRRAAVVRIEHEDKLRQIARQLRGSDKTTARLAEEKRGLLQQQRERVEQRGLLLSDLQAFAEGEKPLNEAVIGRHIRAWQGIKDDADEADLVSFDALQARLRPLLEQQRRRLEQERESRSRRTEIMQALAEMVESGLQPEPKESEQRLQALETRWRELAVMHNPATRERFESDFQQATRRVRELIAQQRQQSRVQHKLDSAIGELQDRLAGGRLTAKSVSAARVRYDSLFAGIEDKQTFEKPLQQVRNLVDKLEARLAEQKTQLAKLQGQLHTRIEALESALRDNALKDALKAHKKAHELLVAAGDPLPPAFKSLQQRLHQNEPALRELKSWRNFGTDHAREELIKEAVVLREAPPANVEKLARQLTDLRARWKALGPLEPGGKAHWEEFDAACTAAYEPVKAKHDADAETRRKNLEQRRTICGQLERLVADTDWDHPDWQTIDRAMTAARREWNKTGGVPHKAWPAIKKRFDDAISDMDGHLEQERVRNFSFRQGLVRKAEALAQEQDNRAATAAARELRDLWQVSVQSHRRKEKQIWQAFSRAMDRVFQKDREARDQFRASLDENRRTAESLCTQLEQLAGEQSPADEKTVGRRRAGLQQAMDRFATLNLPKQARRQLENRFDKACKTLERWFEKRDESRRSDQLGQLYGLHQLCLNMEAVALGPQTDAQAAGDFETQWSAAEKPAREKSTLHAIEQRYQAALAVIMGERSPGMLGDLAANAECKRAICTDLEILLHVESPAAEQDRRMRRQVEILENAMKGGGRNSPEHIRELRLAYLACGPVETELQAGLEQRFSALLHASDPK